MTTFLFIIGFIILIKGADLLVKGASSIAQNFGISNMVIGLTIVSFGTSMPELFVSVLSSVQGNSDIAIGNVLGSNIANILLILGISAIICPLPLKNNTILSEIPFSIMAILLIGYLANTNLPFETGATELSRYDGIISLFFFVLFMLYIFKVLRKNDKETIVETPTKEKQPLGKPILLILLGCIALYFGGKWIVDGAVEIAHYYDLSESIVGLTIVGVGTSLPELATSAVAAYRKNIDIAVGNVIGSNIFNLLWILGVSSVIRPLSFAPSSNTDVLMVLLSSCLLLIALVVGKRNHIDRWNGIFFILIYVLYVVYLISLEYK